MSEEPERIWVWWDDGYDVGLVNTHGDKRYTPDDAREYMPRTEVEAAVKRALEGAAECCDVAAMDGIGDIVRAKGDEIRTLNPAQFVDGEK